MGEEVQCGHCDEVVSVPTSRLATGAVIGDFVILEELGRGGMGVVYLAHQISLDRASALKILQDNYANNAEFVVNFIKEARSAAKLNHPHIVQAYAVGEDEGIFYYAMEYIDGETMKDVLKREKVIPIDKAVKIIQQIAEALDCAWKEQKLIHRDIKPDNIILAKNKRAKLADLGLSRVAGDIEDVNEDEIMGTPQYISPEHLVGAPMDVRSDIYSLGATFYQFVTGRFPYEGRTANEIARKHLESELVAPQLVNSDVPEAVGQIIMKMMKKNVNERYQEAEELVEDLRLFKKGKLSSASSTPKVFSTRTRSLSKTKGGEEDFEGVSTTTTGSLKPIYASPDSTSSKKVLFSDEGGDSLKKPKRKLFVYSFLAIVLIVLAGGVLAWLYVLPMLDEKEEKTAYVKPRIPVFLPQKSFRDEYINAANKLIADYSSKKCDKKLFLTKADAIFKDFPDLLLGKEEQKRAQLVAIYVPLDEANRIASPRAKSRKNYLLIIKRQKAREKLLQAKRTKERKTRAAREARLAKEAVKREEKSFLQEQEVELARLRREKTYNRL